MLSRIYEGYDERENALREEVPSIDEMKSDGIYLYTSDDFIQNLNMYHYNRALVIDGKHSEEDSATNITHAKNSRKIALINAIYNKIKIYGDEYITKYCQLVQQIRTLIIKSKYLGSIDSIFDWFPIGYNDVYKDIYSLDNMGIKFSTSYDYLNKILSELPNNHFYYISSIIDHLEEIIESIKKIEEDGIKDTAMKIVDLYINDPLLANRNAFNRAIVEAIDQEKSRLKDFDKCGETINNYIDIMRYNNYDAMYGRGIRKLDICDFHYYCSEDVHNLMNIIMIWYDHVVDNILYFVINESTVIYPEYVSRYFIPVIMMSNSIFSSSNTYKKSSIDIYWK